MRKRSLGLDLDLNVRLSAGWTVGRPGLVDVFMIAGQSNGRGRGSQYGAGKSETGYYYSGSIFSDLKDPVGDAANSGSRADIGSAWPAFAKRWFELTGRKSVWIARASGGSYKVAGQTPTWDPATATLYTTAVNALNNAVAAVGADARFTLNKVYILWVQGENEGTLIDAATITAQQSEDALTLVFNGFIADVPTLDGIFVSELGRRRDNSREVAYSAERANKADVCTAIGIAHLVWTGAKDLTDAQMKDVDHYATPGYNIMGIAMAEGAFATL